CIKKSRPCRSAFLFSTSLLAACTFQHTQSTLVGFVSSLLSLLCGGQSFVGLAVRFVSSSPCASSCVFGRGQASFAFFGHAVAATGSQNCGQSQSREFQNVVHLVPLKVEIHRATSVMESLRAHTTYNLA